jgi:hypothetical protein
MKTPRTTENSAIITRVMVRLEEQIRIASCENRMADARAIARISGRIMVQIYGNAGTGNLFDLLSDKEVKPAEKPLDYRGLSLENLYQLYEIAGGEDFQDRAGNDLLDTREYQNLADWIEDEEREESCGVDDCDDIDSDQSLGLESRFSPSGGRF